MSLPHAPHLRRTLWLWAPVIAYMAIIFCVSSLSQPPLPAILSDKEGHSFGYTFLGLLMLRAVVRGRWDAISWLTALVAVVLTTVYGVTDEFHQSFVPGREADVADVFADAVGAAIGAALLGTWGIISRVYTRSHMR